MTFRQRSNLRIALAFAPYVLIIIWSLCGAPGLL
jgi:hypothetical protein